MAKRIVDTNVVLWADRYMPGKAVMDQARALAASGVVDGFACPDHMVNIIPPLLWTPEETPLASVVGDLDSLQDAVIMATLAHVAAPKLNVCIAGDPGHTGPADMCQRMWSMASVTEGRVKFQFGPGEIKNLKPFGYSRAQGLKRFEDLLRVSDALWKADGPIDHVGNYWELKQAFIGGAKPYRPEIWSMGTGPKQLDLATTFCDGISAVAPAVWTDPDHCRTEIEKVKHTLVEKGRDPEKFGFGLYCFNLLHEDPKVIDRILDSRIIRWFTVMLGRLNPELWLKEGITPATPEGWAYFKDYVTYETSPEFVEETIAKTTRKMAERSFQYGTPAEVASKLQEYVDAGVTWICFFDFAPLGLEPADAAKSLERQIELCARLKGVPAAGA